MVRAFVVGAAVLAGAAAAPTTFDTTPILPPVINVRPQVLNKTEPHPGFAPAPLPNREAAAPTRAASKDASVSPNVFTRRDQYRGEGLSAADSAQTGQERRVQPGAGINLLMPLQ